MNSRSVQAIFVSALLISLVTSVCWSWHWPLAGDASLMHYVVFLIGKGWAPYRQIIDINLPGSYFFEALSMHVFGAGALGLRLYDLTLLAICGASAFAILPRKEWFGAFFAAAVFSLIHIQDGIAELGQRDLLIAALFISAYGLLTMRWTGLPKFLIFLAAGVLIGATVTIKPLYLPVGLLLGGMSAYELRRERKIALLSWVALITGMLLPSLTALIYLRREHALAAFAQTLIGLLPLHVSLDRRPLSYLLAHCLSPLEPLCAIWLAALVVSRPKFTLPRLRLVLAVAFSFLGYIAQGKGYPYHRYPLLLFLLLLIGWDLTLALRGTAFARVLAMAGLAFGCLFVAPQAAWRIHTFTSFTPFETALANDLANLGGQQLSNQVQCLDTFGGCVNTLYNLRLAQSSGFLYDCYLFTTAQNQETIDYRDAFWEAYKKNPPRVIVLTSQFCFGPLDFNKVNKWPAFATELHSAYTPAEEWIPTEPQHWWSRKELPASFRIYVRNP